MTSPAGPQAALPSFREMFESELPRVWHALRRLGVHDRDLEDQAHEVFMIVHQKLSEYDTSRPIRPWLMGIAYRRAADYRRLARHSVEQITETDQLEVADAGSPADLRLAAKQERDLLAVALGKIDPDRRAALVLHDFEGLPMPEVAEAMGIPLRTAYSRVRVAREELAEAVRRLQIPRRRS